MQDAKQILHKRPVDGHEIFVFFWKSLPPENLAPLVKISTVFADDSLHVGHFAGAHFELVLAVLIGVFILLRLPRRIRLARILQGVEEWASYLANHKYGQAPRPRRKATTATGALRRLSHFLHASSEKPAS